MSVIGFLRDPYVRVTFHHWLFICVILPISLLSVRSFIRLGFIESRHGENFSIFFFSAVKDITALFFFYYRRRLDSHFDLQPLPTFLSTEGRHLISSETRPSFLSDSANICAASFYNTTSSCKPYCSRQAQRRSPTNNADGSLFGVISLFRSFLARRYSPATALLRPSHVARKKTSFDFGLVALATTVEMSMT